MKHISEIETDLTKKIKNKDFDEQISNDQWICPGCGTSKTQYQLRIIPSGRADNYFPKYIPQIKESCTKCGRYRRFSPQYPILIERFNDRLTQLIIPAKGRDFYEE